MVYLIHGPNLNLLGFREREVYGEQKLEEVNKEIKKRAKELNLEVSIFQSNSEGEIINLIHQAREKAKVIIINPGAYTHYSLAIRDALVAVGLPVIEVHLSNIYSREDFRRQSCIAPIARGQISGFGVYSYLLALEVAKAYLEGKVEA